MNLLQQIDAAVQLTTKITPHLSNLQSDYGIGHFKHDFISYPAGSLEQHVLNLVATRETYFSDNWMRTHVNSALSDSMIKKFSDDQIIHLKFFFFVKLFSTIESQFRELCKRIDPTACKSGTDNFKIIYTYVFNQLGLGNKYEPLFDLCRCFRNSIHNNGIHTNPTVTIVYKGTTYTFTQGQQIDFFYLTTQYLLHNDLGDALIDIKGTTRFTTL